MNRTDTVKKIPWWTPQIGDKEIAFIRQALKRHYVNEGELANALENKIAAMLGAKYAVSATSGTAAIFLALKGLGIGPGDEVVVPDITFIATANAVEMCGARPVLADVDADTLNISIDAFAQAITGSTRAVVPVHVSGRAAAMDGITAMAEKKGIVVVEDAAEAFMSKHKGKFLGTFAAAGCFSFSPNKTITTGQGGMIVTDDEKLRTRLRELKDQGRPVRGTGGADRHDVIGYNFKFTDIQAALGLGQLSYLASRLERMKAIYQRYSQRLAALEGIRIFRFDIEGAEAPQWTDAIAEDREGLLEYLSGQGIDCRRYWFPLHTQKPYKLPDDGFPNSAYLSPKALWLPSAFTMTDPDVDRVCDHIKSYYKSKRKRKDAAA
ncbi:DegT/DnrJ/EryC1/StrS family aminotransferase [Candidatus Omnitrophota bacterium]